MKTGFNGVLVYGEVLFDRFEDGTSVMGGAPFNVAWYLHGFGVPVFLVSRVGADALGEAAIERMRGAGMDTRGVQIDEARPTGRVDVRIQDGQPGFEILADQAYDRIEGQAAVSSLAGRRFDILYHGSLILRSDRARRTLRTIRETTGASAFVDVNLRSPWWNAEQVRELLGLARWAKLSESELAEICGASVSPASVRGSMEEMRDRHDLEALTVTMGAEGACFLSAAEFLTVRTAPIPDIVDTVGAGDAFSAVSLVGLCRQWPAGTTLERAIEFAGEVCRIRGATGADHSLCRLYTGKWRA